MDGQNIPDASPPIIRGPDEEKDAFLQAVVDRARVLTGGQASALCLLDSSRTRIRLAAGSGSFAARIGAEAPARRGLSGHVLASPCAVANVVCDSACCPFAARSSHHHVVAPVKAGNAVRGILCATSAAASARSGREPLLVRLAVLAGGCLSGERVCGLAEGLGSLTAQQRIAGDIHDGVAQRLVSLQMQLDRVVGQLPAGVGSRGELHGLRDALAGTIQEVRGMIESLCIPPDAANRGEQIAGILDNAVRDAGSQPGAVTVRAGEDFLVSCEVARELRQIVREAVVNADRHAHASTITVSSRRQPPEALVCIADDGDGMADDGSAVPPHRAHFGVEVMRLRAALIGGRLEIHSATGKGTEIVLRWPDPVA